MKRWKKNLTVTLDMTKSYDFRDSRESNRKLIVQRGEDDIPL